MKRFAHAAKDLKVKKLAENIRKGNSPESVDDLENNDDIPNEGIRTDNEDQAENEYAARSNLYTSDRSKRKMGLYLHTSSTHEGICY